MREYNLPRQFARKLWFLIDRVLLSVYHIRALRADGTSVISFRVRQYKGPTRVLKDGCQVRTGDQIMELHLNNEWFKRRHRLDLKPSQSAREILDCSSRDLHFLAGQMAAGVFGDIAALHGVTLLHMGARRLGFEVGELPDNLWNRGARFYMARLMEVYHWRGSEVTRVRQKPWELKEVWLSKSALLSRYGQRHT